MKKGITLSLASLALASAVQAQDVKVDALLIAWYSQMMDSNMRLNEATPGALKYYGLGGTAGTGTTNPFNENGFSVRRSEIFLAAKLNDQISANIKLDYILRSKNILAPRAGQTGEQGGHSLVAAFQI